MLKTLAVISSLLLFPPSICAYAQKPQWKEFSCEHFVVFYVQDDPFISDVVNKAESYYRRIASELGYSRNSGFWTWENRAKIYIYPDRKSFLEGTRQPEWSRGVADYSNKSISSYVLSDGFLDSILPHETAHLIFRDFVGFKGEVPLWLDEGVAQWAEEYKRTASKDVVKNYYRKNALFSLQDMMSIDIRRVTDKDEVTVRLLRRSGDQPIIAVLDNKTLVQLYYLQSVSLVGFLIDRYGNTDFTRFCRQLRDGNSLNAALRAVYSPDIQDLDNLEKRWVEYIRGLK